MERADHPKNNYCGRVRHPAEALKLTKEELIREWRTLTAKRNTVWEKGENLSTEEDYKLRQIVASLNLYNLNQ